MKKIVVFIITLLFITNLYAQNQLDKARYLFKQAQELRKKNKYTEAIPLLEEATEIFKKNNSTKNYIITSYTLSSTYLNIGSYQKAYNILNKIKQLSISNLGETNDLMINIYSNLAQAHLNLGNNDSAELFFNKAINISKKLHGEESIQIAGLMSNLGILYSTIGKYDLALELLQKSLNIQQTYAENNPSKLIATLNNLAYVYTNIGEYTKAIQVQLQALDLTEKLYKKNSLIYAYALLGLANIYIAKEQYSLAEEYLLNYIDIINKNYGNNIMLLVNAYINLGIIYNAKENYDLSLQYYLTALDIYEQNLEQNNPLVLSLLNNIAIIYRKMGNYETAINYYKQILHLSKSNKNIVAAYTNIASIFFNTDKLDSAIIYYKKVISFISKNYGQYNSSLIIPYMNLGYVYMRKKQYNKALIYFQKAINSNIKQKTDPNLLITPQKIQHYTNGIKLIEALSNKASIFIKLYSETDSILFLQKAFKTFLVADSLVLEIRKLTITQEDKLALNSHSIKIHENAIFTCRLLASKIPQKKDFYLSKAFFFVQRNKASILVEAINATKARKIAGIPDSLVLKEKKLKEQITFLENKLSFLQEYGLINQTELNLENIEDQELKLKTQIFNLKNQYRQLIKFFEKNYPQYFEIKYLPNTIELSKLQKVLSPTQMVISYLYGHQNLYIFTITKDSLSIAVSKINNLSDTIKLFYNAMQSPYMESIKTYTKTAYNIFTYIMPNNIPNYITDLIIIPNDILNIIPFEALLYNDSLPQDLRNFKEYPFLIKKFNISYSYSSYLFYSTHFDKNLSLGPIDFLGIAPGFLKNNTPFFMGERISPLPGTIEEVKSIAKLFAQNTLTYKILIDTNATETNFKNLKLNDYKIIHIATHGFIFSEQPERSALIFSKQEEPDDGFLFVNEIFNLTINTSLVNLSACETGMGKIFKGEGVLGLSRAFLYAGAQNLVISLWKVSDKATVELMTNFYQYLLQENIQITTKTLYNNTLRKAKLKMINSKLSHPFFWASFILIGL